MLSISTGRIKTFVLIALILSSLILCGSLWFDNYHGFSSFFAKFGSIDLTQIFGIKKEDVQSKYEKTIKPLKIVVNNGEEGHWVIYPSEQKHEVLWKKTKALLKNVVTKDSPIKANIINESEWNGLKTKSSIMCFFDYPLNNQMLSMLFKTELKRLDDPEQNISSTALTRFGENIILYVKGTTNNLPIYKKYYFSDSDIKNKNYQDEDILTDQDFKDVFDDYNLIKYTLMKEAFENIKLKLKYKYNDDVFIPLFSYSDTRINRVKFNKVEFASEFSIEETKQREEIVNKFFAGRDYSKFIKKDGTHIFIDEKNNTLRIYPEGVFEFESIFEEKNKMDFQSNFMLALQKVEEFGGINGLILTSFQNTNGQMKFLFDYTVNGIPVDFRKKEKPEEILSAVEVSITPEQVKYSRRYNNFVVLDEEYSITTDFENIINAVFKKAGTESSNVMIEDIKLEYVIYNQNNNDSLPVWLVRFRTNSGEKWVTAKATEDRR